MRGMARACMRAEHNGSAADALRCCILYNMAANVESSNNCPNLAMTDTGQYLRTAPLVTDVTWCGFTYYILK